MRLPSQILVGNDAFGQSTDARTTEKQLQRLAAQELHQNLDGHWYQIMMDGDDKIRLVKGLQDDVNKVAQPRTIGRVDSIPKALS
jgi:hypothetical protein